MAFRILVRHRGREYEVDSVSSLEALLDQLEARDRRHVPSPPSEPRAAALLTTSLEAQLVRVLERIRLNRKGLESSEIGKLADVKDARGLGSATRGWRRVLHGLGFSLDDAMVSARDLGQRLWLPGPKVEEVLRVLREREKAGQREHST